jgi:hypothetical protein
LSPLALIFLLVAAGAVLFLPRQWSPLGILLSVFFMTEGPGFDVGGARFTILRLVIVFAVIRVFVRGEVFSIRFSAIDKAVVIWAIIAVIVCPLRKDAADAFKFNMGMILDCGGIYIFFRSVCRNPQEVRTLAAMLGIAIMMLMPAIVLERKTGQNPFARFGGVNEDSATRDGKVRAQGPFQVYITTGTAAAITVPFLWVLLGERKRFAQMAIASCAVIVFCCKSSGPILTLGAASFGLWMWKRRQYLSKIIWSGIGTLILLEFVMKNHVWYLMAKIDFTGGSTGYHRSELITQALAHLGEWWLAGTNYTRHWMVTGIEWSSDHTDITNYYIKIGVLGGLPLVFGFIYVIKKSFNAISETLGRLDVSAEDTEEAEEKGALVWTLGNVLFCHAFTFVSVSYFDQTFVLFWMVPGVIASIHQLYAFQPFEIENEATEECPALSP